MAEAHTVQNMRNEGEGGPQGEDGGPQPHPAMSTEQPNAEEATAAEEAAEAADLQQQQPEAAAAQEANGDNPTEKILAAPQQQQHPDKSRRSSSSCCRSSSSCCRSSSVSCSPVSAAAEPEGCVDTADAAAEPEGCGDTADAAAEPTATSRASSKESSSLSGCPSADAKQRARLKRQFVRNQWLDINKAPSWPPIKKNRYLESDWQSVDFRPQTLETKKSRLFLNSLCYLCEGVITKKSTLGRRAGLGLFCERPEGFAKGTVITEFVGWLVDREQAEQLRKRRRASHIVAVQKGFLYIDGVKDPYYGTGGASFANDGSEFLGGPGNNSYFYHWFDEEIGRTRVFLRATRRIENGEEIFVPYDKNYWQDNFEEQEENCPDAFRKKKIEQLQRKYNDYTITSMEDLKARQALLEKKRQEKQKKEETKKKPKKHNIKRPLSAYMRFSVSRRKDIIEKEPELRHPKCFKEIAQRISQEWKELNLRRRKELEKEAAADLEKYKRKVQEWKEKHLPKRKKKGRRGLRSPAGLATAARGKAEGKKQEQEVEEETEGENKPAEAANAATNVPESSDEASNNRQSSTSEAAAGEAEANKTEETLDAALAEAATATADA